MKTVAVLISLLAVSGIYLFASNSNNSLLSQAQSNEDIRIFQAYQQWKSDFNKNTNGEEDQMRLALFKDNYQFIEQHNAENSDLVLGLTPFAAMDNEEYRQNVLLRSRPSRQVPDSSIYASSGKDLPTSIDWVAKGAVYATQNQGHCGSCWAFATIGGLQGLRQISTGKLELLSAQQITSCVDKRFLDDYTQGCGGGEARYAYMYTAINGIETWENYPYVDGDDSSTVASPCKYNQKNAVFYNEGVSFIRPNDVQGIKEKLNQQPLTIAVDAGSIYFQLYKNGVINTDKCGIELNHAILLVGYNLEGETPYWTVQNSWGTGWGNNGFGNIAITEGNGVCGINMQVDYPTSVTQSQ